MPTWLELALTTQFPTRGAIRSRQPTGSSDWALLTFVDTSKIASIVADQAKGITAYQELRQGVLDVNAWHCLNTSQPHPWR